MMDTTGADKTFETVRRLQALKQALEASAAGEAPSNGDLEQHLEQIAEQVCDGPVGIDAEDIRHALCGPSGQPPKELALAHGLFSAGPDDAYGIASLLDQIPAANWPHKNGVFMVATTAPDIKLSQIRELCQAIHARQPKDGVFFFGTAIDARMTAGLCSVALLAARW